MQSQPQKEHEWLQRLVGEWTGEWECDMGPDQPKARSQGTEVVRSLGGLWTVGEGEGECPTTHQLVKSIMTLGYDPQRERFIGTFVASMMAHLWRYEGTLDASGRRLVLDTEGPSFDPAATGLVKYQDIIEFIDDDHRTLASQVLGEDGQWRQFMIGHYRRAVQNEGRPETHSGQRSRKNEVHAAGL